MAERTKQRGKLGKRKENHTNENREIIWKATLLDVVVAPKNWPQ